MSTGRIVYPRIVVNKFVFNRFSDRFITGTDFVATYGNKKEYPGLKRPPTGCMKDKVTKL